MGIGVPLRFVTYLRLTQRPCLDELLVSNHSNGFINKNRLIVAMKVELLRGHISAEFVVSWADNRIKKYVKNQLFL